MRQIKSLDRFDRVKSRANRSRAVSGKVDPVFRVHSPLNLLNLDQIVRRQSIPIYGGLI
jgi:hypothetical protein